MSESQSLSDHERRLLDATDRVLSRDPILRAVSELFPRPPAMARRARHAETPAAGPSPAHRLLLVMVWSLVAMAAGLATTVVTAAVARQVLAVGPTVMVAAAAAFTVAAIRRGMTVVGSPPVAAVG